MSAYAWMIEEPALPQIKPDSFGHIFPSLLAHPIADSEDNSGRALVTQGLMPHTTLSCLWLLLKSIKSLLPETANPCMFPHVKDLLCRGKQPGPSAAPQRDTVFPSPCSFFISLYCDFIQATPVAFNSSLPLAV